MTDFEPPPKQTPPKQAPPEQAPPEQAPAEQTPPKHAPPEHDAVARVRAALAAAGLADGIREFPAGTRTAADAAAAVGVAVGRIAKSIVFRAGDDPVLVIASGANRVSKAKVARVIGVKLAPAGADFVIATTGFAPGGVSPFGHRDGLPIVIDRDLLQFPTIWAAAGSARHVFEIAPADLVRLAGGRVADTRQDPP